jgi:hypothetical protein
MLLQAHEGLSDGEGTDRLAFDLRWKAAAGLPVAAESFHPTVLVGMRNRLRASVRPRWLVEDVTVLARSAGLLRGRRRVFDSTPLYDAVATQDTVSQLRAAIRKLLMVADRDAPSMATAVRGGLTRDDDYATVGKPPCDWDDKAAREALVDALVRDAQAALAAADGHQVSGPVGAAVELLALLAGQDVEQGEDGVFRIARKVARDRIISTVDPQARHGHKSRARTFDGYQAHLGVDPDDELITNVAVTPANTPDRDVVDDLLDEPDTAADVEAGEGKQLFGDSAYADGATVEKLTEAGHDMHTKVAPVRNANGFSKDRFVIDPDAGTVTCPARHTVAIHPQRRGGQARFGDLCTGCPLRAACTRSRTGTVIAIHPHEATLQRAKTAQRDPHRQQAYRQTRPLVERKISHFTHRARGARRARCRGTARVLTDVVHRAAALNLARLAALDLHNTPTGCAITRRTDSPDLPHRTPSAAHTNQDCRTNNTGPAPHQRARPAERAQPLNSHYNRGVLAHVGLEDLDEGVEVAGTGRREEGVDHRRGQRLSHGSTESTLRPSSSSASDDARCGRGRWPTPADTEPHCRVMPAVG